MFFSFSPVVIKKAKAPEIKQDKSEDVTTITLAPFTANPKVLFEDVEVGKQVTRKLAIKNPSSVDVDVLISHEIPEDFGISFNWDCQNIGPSGEQILALDWCPKTVQSVRFTFQIQYGKKAKKEVSVVFKSVSLKGKVKNPKAKKATFVTKKPKSSIVKKSPPKRTFITKSSPTKSFTAAYTKQKYKSDYYCENKENYSNNLEYNQKPLLPVDLLENDDRRYTYAVGNPIFQHTIPNVLSPNSSLKSPEHSFSDSLETIDNTPHKKCKTNNTSGNSASKLQIVITPGVDFKQTNQRENRLLSKLQSESFSLSPCINTPKRSKFEPTSFSTEEKSPQLNDLTHSIKNNVKDKYNNLFKNDASRCFNSSSEPQALLNFSSETYNVSSETYVKGNLSGGTYVKDSSFGSLSLNASPVHGIEFHSTKIAHFLKPINEEASASSFNSLSKLGKRKCNVEADCPSPKYSKRITRNKDSPDCVVMKNPYLLAATSMIDPFMTSTLYFEQEWIEEQEKGFKKWLNALLTPPEELNTDTEVHPVDVAKLWKECSKKEVAEAPTKEVISNKYHTNARLNSLRKSARLLYCSEEMTSTLSKVVASIHKEKLSIRKDKHIHLDLGLQCEIMSLILSYNPLWLRIGLETVYNKVIPLNSNSDMVGLSTFVSQNFFKNQHLIRKYKTIHSDKYADAIKKIILEKFFALVYFLDKAKNKKLIPHDPCLFNKNAPVKESREIIIRFSRETLSSIGDVTKCLRLYGYIVEHKQTYINEFNYAVKCLGADLRDGVRLTKVMEIILIREDLTKSLRVPAISRLQKIHNMKLVFESLQAAGYEILHQISPKDIVDGHREKTLSFLWQIIYKFQAPLMVKSVTTIQMWWRSLPVMLKRKQLERKRLVREMAVLRRNKAASKIQSFYRMYKCKQLYEKIQSRRRAAVIVIQKNLRSWIARRHFLKLKSAVLFVEEQYLAVKLMEREKVKYEALRYMVIFVQRRFRANKSMQVARNYYLQLKTSTVFIQRKFIANTKMKIERGQFLQLKTAAIIIQTRFRAIRAMRQEFNKFSVLKQSVVTIQRRFRAQKSMQVARNNYLQLKTSTVFIQRKFIANTKMKTERGQFLQLKTATRTIQSRFRAIRAMRQEYNKFNVLKQSVVTIQRRFRAQKSMQVARNNYLQLKTSTVFIQRKFIANKKMKTERRQFLQLKTSAIKIQSRFRAIRAMRQEFNKFNALKQSVVTIQRRFRAKKSMQVARNDYLQLKASTVFIQRTFIANRMMKTKREQFLQLKTATRTIQSRFRAICAMRQEYNKFNTLKQSVVTIQRRFRAQKSMQVARNDYLQLKTSTVFIQRKFIANAKMKTGRAQFLQLKTATRTIQSRFRAIRAMRQEFNKFNTLKQSVLTIQRRYRANKLMQTQNKAYLELRRSSILLQRRWRSLLLYRAARNNYLQMHAATIRIQRYYRAYSLKKKENLCVVTIQKYVRRYLARKQYLQLKKSVTIIEQRYLEYRKTIMLRNGFLEVKKAASVIQTHFRAMRLMNQQRKSYIKLVNSTIIIQQRYRAQKSMLYERDHYVKLKRFTKLIQQRWRSKKVYLSVRNSFLKQRAAAVKIQQSYRAYKAGKEARSYYVKLKLSTVLVQNKYSALLKMRRDRDNYIKTKNAAVKVQRFYRGYLDMKKLSTILSVKKKVIVKVQALVRGFIARRRCARSLLIVKMQALIRGFLVRKQYSHLLTKEAIEERIQFKKQSAAAVKIQASWRGHLARKVEDPRLKFVRQRSEEANLNADPANTLGRRADQAIYYILDEKITLLQMTNAFIDLEYVTRRCKDTCLHVCNILPELIYAIITNANRSLPEMNTCNAATHILINLYKYEETSKTVFIPRYIEKILTVMLHYCDKESLLFPSLCTLLWLFAHNAEYKSVIKTVRNYEQIICKLETLCRRKQQMVLKAGVKGSSVFGSFKNLYLPTLAPDWGLEYPEKPKAFTNSLHACINFLQVLNEE